MAATAAVPTHVTKIAPLDDLAWDRTVTTLLLDMILPLTAPAVLPPGLLLPLRCLFLSLSLLPFLSPFAPLLKTMPKEREVDEG